MPAINGPGSPNIPTVLFTEQGSDPATPAAATDQLYFKTAGPYFKNSAGVVTQLATNTTTANASAAAALYLAANFF